MIKILHVPAVYLSSIQKSLTLERVIYRIEKEGLIGTIEEKRGKEFITWGQFFDYFTDIQSQSQKIKKKKRDGKSEDDKEREL